MDFDATVTTEQAKTLIEQSGGKIFRVTFIKRTDGQVRRMLARIGVRKWHRGGTLGYNQVQKRLMIVGDIQKRSYRAISYDNITELAMSGLRLAVAA